MRLLHVAPSFCPAWEYGGIPRCAYELCRTLALRGDAVSVWTSDALDAASRVSERESLVDGVRVRRFPNLSNRLAYRHQLYLPLGLWRAARDQLRGFDLVHIHSHRHLLELIVAGSARRLGIPYVLTGNGTVPAIERYRTVKQALDRLRFRAVLRGAALCIAVSRTEVTHYLGQGVGPNRIRVIPNGVRLEEFELLPSPGTFRRKYGLGDEPLVLFVGKITPRKGVDVLIRAAAQLPRSVRCVIAGNFMMPEDQIRGLVDQLGLTERVLFCGFLDGSERNAAYIDADVVAYPSVHEIFGLVVAEALMCNAPVVACDDSGCGELVRESGGGLTVPYGDAMGLAAALDVLLKDAGKRERCVARGRAFVEQNLSWDSIADQTRELYAQIVTDRFQAIDAPGDSRRGSSGVDA